jgi:hypothetical protein
MRVIHDCTILPCLRTRQSPSVRRTGLWKRGWWFSVGSSATQSADLHRRAMATSEAQSLSKSRKMRNEPADRPITPSSGKLALFCTPGQFPDCSNVFNQMGFVSHFSFLIGVHRRPSAAKNSNPESRTAKLALCVKIRPWGAFPLFITFHHISTLSCKAKLPSAPPTMSAKIPTCPRL